MTDTTEPNTMTTTLTRSLEDMNPDLLPIALNERTVATIARLHGALRSDDHPLKFSISARSAASPSDRQLLEIRRAELMIANAAAPMARLRMAVAHLLSGFPPASGDTGDARRTVDAYLLALEGQPYYAVREAILRFMRGKVDRKDHSFAPKPPEMAREAERIATEYRAEEYKIGMILDARVEPEPDEGARRAAVERWENEIKPAMMAAKTKGDAR